MNLFDKIRYKIISIFGNFQRSDLQKIIPRQDVLKLIPKNSTGAELGVFRGAFTKSILQITTPKKLYLMDTWWTLYGEYYPDWGKYTNYGKLKTKEAYQETVDCIKKYDKYNASTLLIGDDVKHINELPENHLDWVYLDSSHEYEHTKKELEALRTKVKSTGIITGDDWLEDPNHIHHGVCKAVKEFCAKYNWEVFYVDSFYQWGMKEKK